MGCKKLLVGSLICLALVCPAQVRGWPNCDAGKLGVLLGGTSLFFTFLRMVGGGYSAEIEKLEAKEAKHDKELAVLKAQTNMLLTRAGLAPFEDNSNGKLISGNVRGHTVQVVK